MKEYKIIDGCLKTLRDSHVDTMQKLRMENLFVAMKMLLLMDISDDPAIPEALRHDSFEELLNRVKQVCAGGSADGVTGLLDHVKKMKSAMAQCLNVC
jgi:hypothetical protein